MITRDTVDNKKAFGRRSCYSLLFLNANKFILPKTGISVDKTDILRYDIINRKKPDKEDFI